MIFGRDVWFGLVGLGEFVCGVFGWEGNCICEVGNDFWLVFLMGGVVWFWVVLVVFLVEVLFCWFFDGLFIVVKLELKEGLLMVVDIVVGVGFRVEVGVIVGVVVGVEVVVVVGFGVGFGVDVVLGCKEVFM